MKNLKRRAFSFIEFIILFLALAFLVALGPQISNYILYPIPRRSRTDARQDLDVIRNAITLHDAQNKALTGTKLDPLVGRYLQELPLDPWGLAPKDNVIVFSLTKSFKLVSEKSFCDGTELLTDTSKIGAGLQMPLSSPALNRGVKIERF